VLDPLLALRDPLVTDSLRGPHDPLLANRQFGFLVKVFAGLLETGGVRSGIDHLLEDRRTDRVIRPDAQGFRLREKKPCGIACIARGILARRPLHV